MVVNNRNSSPPENLDNLKMEKGLILNTENLNEDAVNEILDILEENNLIKGWNFDRTDTNTDTEHNHYYFDSSLDNNSLNSIINNYLAGKSIDAQLKKMIDKKGEIMTYQLKGTLDKSQEAVNLDQDTKTKLLNKIEDFRYISMDKDGSTRVRTFKENLGLKRTAKPENLLNGQDADGLNGIYAFEFNLDKEIDKEAEKEILAKAQEAFYDTFSRYNDFDPTLTKFDVKVEDNKIKIEFNNIFKLENSPEIFMLSKKNVMRDMEVFLKNINDKTSMDIKFSNIRYTKNEQDLQKIISKSQQKQQTQQQAQAPKLQRSEEAQKLESEIKNIEPSWLNFLYGKSLKELKLLMQNLKDAKVHINAVKDFLGEEIAKEKIQEVDEKMKLISKREAELNAELTLKETVENLSKEVETLKDSVKDLTEENIALKAVVKVKTANIKTLTDDVEKLSGLYKDMTEQANSLNAKNGTLEAKLERVSKELEGVNSQNKTIKAELISFKHQVNAAKTYTATLQEEISTLKEKENSKNLEIERLKKELEISKSKEVSVADKADFEVSNKQQARQEARNKAKKHLDSVKKREDSKKKEDPKKSNIEDDFGDR